MEPHELYDDKFAKLVENATDIPIDSDAATTAMKNLKLFSECRPPQPEPEPETPYVPTTKWEKVKAAVASVWDNETTRTTIKAGGALAGVFVVTYTTIKKDHIIERQAISQANQRNS